MRINDKARIFYPGAINKVGYIKELLEQGSLDYGVEALDGSWYRLKECEVDLISEVE